MFYNNCDVKRNWVILVIEIGSNMFILCKVFGYNSSSLNSDLLDTIEVNIHGLSAKFPMAKVIIGGNFNMVDDNVLYKFPPSTFYQNRNIFCKNIEVFDIWGHRRHMGTQENDPAITD